MTPSKLRCKTRSLALYYAESKYGPIKLHSEYGPINEYGPIKLYSECGPIKLHYVSSDAEVLSAFLVHAVSYPANLER